MFLPIRDRNPVRITPYVTYALILANLGVFIYEISLPTQQALVDFFHLYAIVPRELTASLQGVDSGQPVPEILTLVTSQFLHGGFAHVGGNMLFLWIFGNNIEEKLGRWRYLEFYLG
ncbi:putative membrane protein, partial [Rubidibacter lacunae KORDI 51-2]